jgi:hypothetical protein
LPDAQNGAQRASRHHRLVLASIVAGLAAISLSSTVSAATPSVDGGSQTIDSVSGSATPLGADSITSTAPWLSVERFTFFLVNCTRTGGWVLSDGSCRGYGSGHYSTYVRPLRLSSGISDRASRPYAKLLAVRNQCSHYADRDPGYRLRRAGFHPAYWGENIGCGSGYSTAKQAALAFHRMMQAEKSYSGGHWKAMKNRYYVYVGIGVWKYGSRSRLVEDFYRST